MDEIIAREPTDDDIAYLARHMRARDVEEIQAASGCNPLTSVRRSVATSVWARSFFLNGQLMCIAGLALFEGGTLAAPWALSTHMLDLHPKAFVKHSREIVRDLLAIHPHLMNFVDARNTKSIRWLRGVGFTILPAIPYGASGLPFHPFAMRA